MARKGILSQEEIDALLGIARSSNRLIKLKETKSSKIKEAKKSLSEKNLSAVNLMINVLLTYKTITLEEYLGLQIGDFLPLELAPTVTINLAKTPVFTATIERYIDKRALKLVDRLSYD
ncbi:FliM/FliN family flagellar motor switch protein [Legionella gresilensis]|uniref:FliM/FliN family flagellar motor switch protein n=1 Tax=Legionella gresilensis TaxID=91823 RepID=UPI001041B444|nr:FliM/FliN family flagellar motor switch protein [Legionella gresilensis]